MLEPEEHIVVDKDQLMNNFNDLEFVEVEDELKCRRCLRVLIYNYKANCGHCFCRNCKDIYSPINRWKCPACEAINSDANANDAEIESKVMKLRVHCLNKKYGCPEITALKDSMLHLKRCKYKTDDVSPKTSIRNSLVMDRIGKFPNLIKKSKDEANDFKTTTTENVQWKKDLAEKLSNLEQKVNELSAQTQTILTFLSQLDKQQKKINSKLKSPKNVNILLMGKSGSGKSTLINSFANYCQFSTFEESKLSKEKSLINTKITVMNEDYEDYFITTGTSDSNECMERNQSSTLACKSYLFPINDNLRIRLIDTAGFASTMGPKYDDDSVKDITSFLGQYENLHAVAIVIKGKESRITTKFDYCIQQTLTIFHKSAAPNIIFIFTRTTQVADSLQTIKSALSEIERKSSTSFSIKMSRKNVFCFENEGFNSIIAVRNGITIDENDFADSISSWNLAKSEFERFINQTIQLEPFRVCETLRINEVRVFIEDLNKVLEHLRKAVDYKQNQMLKLDKENNVIKAQSIKEHLEILKKEKLIMLEAIKTSSKYIYNEAILYFNFAKRDYLKIFKNPPDIATDTCETLEKNFSFASINKANGNDYLVSYSDIEDLKKELLLMDIYGCKLSSLFQYINSKKVIVKREKIVKV